MSSLDGENRRILVNKDIGLPNGLTFDPFSKLLCWADAGNTVDGVHIQNTTACSECEHSDFTIKPDPTLQNVWFKFITLQQMLYAFHSSRPQPFWHQRLVSWKTDFPWPGEDRTFWDDLSRLYLLCTLFLLLIVLALLQIIRH